MNPEKERLQQSEWKIWGPYLSDRQWGTVREDYSKDGEAWFNLTHDMARSKAYRWGEDGIGGISDYQQLLCFAPAFWNGSDPILKERLFGLTPHEGNHGEDVKEYYYYLDNTPTHSYMKMLYKYPQLKFPYIELVAENKRRGLDSNEFELIETGIFDSNEYFDIELEYVKQSATNILVKISVHNRSKYKASLLLLPQVWFSNTWSWNDLPDKPKLFAINNDTVKAEHSQLGDYYIFFNNCSDMLFCENETNNKKLYSWDDGNQFPKDGINDYVINNAATVNPDKGGTKAAAVYNLSLEPHASAFTWVQLSNQNNPLTTDSMEQTLAIRKTEADVFYEAIQNGIANTEERNIQRQAFAGLLWSKQFYYYNISQWLSGDSHEIKPPVERLTGRNAGWKHFYANDIICMPDKWEYPWFAAWDTAFHTIPLSLVDPGMAKEQLRLLTHEWYMHPNGQLPGYEWEFNNVNPPVHAWAAWYIYTQDKIHNNNNGDHTFLKSIFNRLLINFTWWVNREDKAGNNIFEGGYLGLDNIGIFDRNQALPDGSIMEQSDGTSWMAMYCLKMMRISLELAEEDAVYEDMATKFFEHFMYIAGAMASMGETATGLWDEEDEFFYDQLKFSDNSTLKLKVKSLVGLLPLMCVEVISHETLSKFPEFAKRLNWFLKHKPALASLVSRLDEQGKLDKHIFSLLRGHRLKAILRRILDPHEFFSEYGIRSVSKFHEQHPFVLKFDNEQYAVQYNAAESKTPMFGGNSNWRGPVWLPINFLLIQSLLQFHEYYGDDFIIPSPDNSGNSYTLKEISTDIAARLLRIYIPDEFGARPVNRLYLKFQEDTYFKDHLLFYEYFDGDNGRGVGASHQTGWTALLANLIQQFQSTNTPINASA
jgi:hypothetical protein